jgi:DNA repair protein SbcD/Mre11
VATLVHTADLHLDRPVHSPALPDAARDAVDRLVHAVLGVAADALLIAGDVWDREHVKPDAVDFFAERMSTLGEAGTVVFVVDGNHDACHPDRAQWPLPPNVHWFGPGRPGTRVLEDAGVAIHGRGLPDPHWQADLAADYPAPVRSMANIGMLHTSLDGRFGGAVCAPTTVEVLAQQNYQYWALGHVHRRAVVHRHAPWIVYPGTPQAGPAEEGAPPTATVITTEDREVTALREVHLTDPAVTR